MGLLEGKSQQLYYQNVGEKLGSYQFTSLDDIINNFMVAYIGEDKIISKARRVDVAFHAQRALQELSFDTFKSCKTQEIVVPNTLQMILPQDYVNYVKMTWSDSSGIEHLIYPTSKTSNPFPIKQDDDGGYYFKADRELLINGDFSNAFDGWLKSNVRGHTIPNKADTITTISNGVQFNQHLRNQFGATQSPPLSNLYTCVQVLDVAGVTEISLKATGNPSAAISRTTSTGTPSGIQDGILSVGIEASDITGSVANQTTPHYSNNPSGLPGARVFRDFGYGDPNSSGGNGLGVLEFDYSTDGASSTKELSVDEGTSIDVSSYSTVYLVIRSFHFFEAGSNNANSQETITQSVTDLSVTTIDGDGELSTLQTGRSRTWDNFKSHKRAENNINDYQDYQNHGYWPNEGERYGLDPQHAQVNGSYFIDCMRGKIFFSSNISGRTVILKYISDSLGTDEEMVVHKFAEEAMYKWLMHAILSTKANIPEYQVARYKKERRAAIRQAKLRLSNIKLEEITQILRGKSKHIKH
jgi:hypothetical protein